MNDWAVLGIAHYILIPLAIGLFICDKPICGLFQINVDTLWSSFTSFFKLDSLVGEKPRDVFKRMFYAPLTFPLMVITFLTLLLIWFSLIGNVSILVFLFYIVFSIFRVVSLLFLSLFHWVLTGITPEN